MPKKRLDILVSELNPEMSRERAKAEIMAGSVYVNNQKEIKPGLLFPEDSKIEVRGKALRYVSRGGLKLEKALDVFDIDVKGKICFDAGASTGGFTDCLLQKGAAKVYAADVGHGQLDWELRNNPHVVVMEKTNVRFISSDMLNDVIQFACADVSFISLKLIIPPMLNILDDKKEMVLLIKPQFEAGREKVKKGGVVRDKLVHIEVISGIAEFVNSLGLSVCGINYSPVKGPEGNIEYLLHAAKAELKGRNFVTKNSDYISSIVNEAHNALK